MASSADSAKRRGKRTHSAPRLETTVRFSNPLPPPPFPPKFAPFAQPLEPLGVYHEPDLQGSFSYRIIPGLDVGVTMNLLDDKQFAAGDADQLDKEDRDLITPIEKLPPDNWLEMLKTHTHVSKRKTLMKINSVAYGKEAKVERRPIAEDVIQEMDEDKNEVRRIEATFERAAERLAAPVVIHPNKSKRVRKAVSITPILPNFPRFNDELVQVSFDAKSILPELKGKQIPSIRSELDSTLVRVSDPETSAELFKATATTTESLKADVNIGDVLRFAKARDLVPRVTELDLDSADTFVITRGNLEGVDGCFLYTPIRKKLKLAIKARGGAVSGHGIEILPIEVREPTQEEQQQAKFDHAIRPGEAAEEEADDFDSAYLD
eukprot:m.174539 g.174539  ORF g.174539 m.174539 type:complete len:378 (+) comp14592_c2_seq1:139-1272(+)